MPPETGSLDASPTGSLPETPAGTALATGREGYGETARKVLRKVAPPDPPPREFAAGEEFPLFGTPRRVVTESGRDDHAVVRDELVLAEPRTGTLDVRSALSNLYRTVARRRLADRVDTHANRMGIRTPSVELFDSPTRLVDCGPAPPVGVNWRVVMAPREVLDHAAVHALAHLRDGPHTADFRETVRQHRPEFDYGEWLDSGGIALRLPP